MKFTEEALRQAHQMRSQGEKWAVVEAVLGKGVKNAAMYHFDPYTCEYCKSENHRNRHFCRTCGVITETGKSA